MPANEAEPDSVRALREALDQPNALHDLYAYRTLNDAARVLLVALPGLLAEAWDEGVEFALQMVNPNLINDTWDKHNPYRVAADEMVRPGQEVD